MHRAVLAKYARGEVGRSMVRFGDFAGIWSQDTIAKAEDWQKSASFTDF
jgi:hypothetical protein